MADLSKRSEKKLIHQLKNGKESAFECIYDQYWQVLFNQAYKRLPQSEVVKELIQDLFTELWQKRSSLEVHSSLSAYLHTALRYKIFNHIKAEMVREKHRASLLPSRESCLVEEYMLYQELADAHQKEVDQLPPQAQRVYALRHEEALSYAQIADTLQISVSTVEKHMIKALKIIRENLKEYAVTVSVVLLYC